eukprot:9877004-Ditylum_brightwellii.AAC.1
MPMSEDKAYLDKEVSMLNLLPPNFALEETTARWPRGPKHPHLSAPLAFVRQKKTFLSVPPTGYHS